MIAHHPWLFLTSKSIPRWVPAQSMSCNSKLICKENCLMSFVPEESNWNKVKLSPCKTMAWLKFKLDMCGVHYWVNWSFQKKTHHQLRCKDLSSSQVKPKPRTQSLVYNPVHYEGTQEISQTCAVIRNIVRDTHALLSKHTHSWYVVSCVPT